MRLIDANKLCPTEQRVADIGGGMVVGVGYTLDFDKVVNAPTVEAIPIDWIREWGMKNWVRTGDPDWDILASKLTDDWRRENG